MGLENRVEVREVAAANMMSAVTETVSGAAITVCPMMICTICYTYLLKMSEGVSTSNVMYKLQ